MLNTSTVRTILINKSSPEVPARRIKYRINIIHIGDFALLLHSLNWSKDQLVQSGAGAIGLVQGTAGLQL